VVFGLPPLSHEREAVFAAKAALEIKDFYSDLDYQDYAISLSTGMIFTAVLPHDSPYRRDPSIAGDTIVVAVRMLKFPFSKRNVVCDLATKNQIGGLCEFEDYGEHLMKGKVKTAPIYGIQKFGPSQRENRVSTLSVEKGNDFIGYRLEMKQATDIVEDWNKAPNHHVLVISGSSGVGKSFFCNNLQKKIASLGVLTWYVDFIWKEDQMYLSDTSTFSFFKKSKSFPSKAGHRRQKVFFKMV
jgi:hypothetical protein